MLAVIGDVHGCLHTFSELYHNVKTKYPEIDVYCVGDLVDRGNYSSETIDFCISKNIKCCLGNHDLMFLSYFRDPTSLMAKSWMFNGHLSTLNSYKNNPMRLEVHLDYVEKLKLFYNTGDCFISHAGVSSKYKKYFGDYKLDGTYDDFIHSLLVKDLDQDHSILWVRGNLIKLSKLQIVGHSRKFDLLFDEYSNVYYIDTGCAYGNKLTSVIVDNNKVIEKFEVHVKREDIISLWS